MERTLFAILFHSLKPFLGLDQLCLKFDGVSDIQCLDGRLPVIKAGDMAVVILPLLDGRPSNPTCGEELIYPRLGGCNRINVVCGHVQG